MPISKIFFWYVLSFILGIIFSLYLKFPVWEFFVLFFIYFILSFFVKKNWRKSFLIGSICILFFGLGVVRVESFSEKENSIEIFSGVKEKIKEGVSENFSSPYDGIIIAILIGDKSEISFDWKEKLKRSGLYHVTAISGMHIMILSFLLMFLCKKIKISVIFSLIFLWVYILFIGLPPSAFRAGIMGSLYILSIVLGRQNLSSRSIFLAGGLMLFIDPYLFNSIGFQLSFMASFGIIYLYPILKKYVGSVLGVSLGAQIFVFPLLLFHFSETSIISPLSNFLVVPFIPIIMILGLIFLGAYFIVPFFGIFFSWILRIFLGYMGFWIEVLSRFPYLKIEVGFFGLIILYFIIFWGVKRTRKADIMKV